MKNSKLSALYEAKKLTSLLVFWPWKADRGKNINLNNTTEEAPSPTDRGRS